MYENLEYIKMFARFPFGLRRFLRHTLTLEEAQAIVRERMARREENFLSSVERSVYGYPASPYLWLLKQARCELNDLRALVRRLGLEGTLRELRGRGGVVTFEEFKGRRPIVRNGNTLPVTARDFDNPSVHRVFNLTTGGSTGTAVTVGVDLDQIAASAPHELL